MRIAFNKKHFTKAERIFGRLLQDLHIEFQTKVKIKNKEIDFLIGKYAIEIDGHEQFSEKNSLLVEAGYSPLHFSNQDILASREKVAHILIKLCIQD